MSQSEAADPCQTNAGSRWKSFKSKGHTRPVSTLADKCQESDQDCGDDDLFDLTNSSRSCRDGWMKSSESPTWGLDGGSSPVTYSLVLLSDGIESEAACSNAESAEMVLVSESEDEPLDLSLSPYSGPNVSPERIISPVTHMLSLSQSQEPSSPESSGAEAGLTFRIGFSGRESAPTGRGSEGLIVIGCEDEDCEDGSVSDGSHCSFASGPSKLRSPIPQRPCASCLRLHANMKRQPNRTKTRVKDPACLDYDQWMLLKPWRSRGVHGFPRVRGKLFEHLPLIRRRAKVRAEEDLEDKYEVCTRPHVFLQRNFRHCQKSQPKFLKRKQVRKRAGSRGGRRSANLWPPIGGPIAKKKRKSLEDSINKKRKSVREEKNMRRRREETSVTDEQDEDSMLLGKEHPSYDVTADCSIEENANRQSPDRRMDTITDTQTNGCPDKHVNVNAQSHSDRHAGADIGSRPHRRTDRNAVGSSDGREARLGDLRTDRRRDKQCSNQDSVLKADGHSKVKAVKHIVSGSDRHADISTYKPIIRLVRCGNVRGDFNTARQMDRPRQAPHSPESRSNNHLEVASSRHSDVAPSIHLNSPSIMIGNKVLDGAGSLVDSRVEVSSDKRADLSSCGKAGAGQTRRSLTFEDLLKKPPSTTPMMSVSKATPVLGSEDPYTFRTPTPPGAQTFEMLRKHHPFARTYENTGARPAGFKSMLSTLDRKHCAVVRENYP
ncbi:uncharacterized protein LOC105911678 isoform X3 [Clupea harengus]|nr:uncharacterized protein LOC105911678 isoform X3 [Clupea harengus]